MQVPHAKCTHASAMHMRPSASQPMSPPQQVDTLIYSKTTLDPPPCDSRRISMLNVALPFDSQCYAMLTTNLPLFYSQQIGTLGYATAV